jgi:hypothetical protein
MIGNFLIDFSDRRERMPLLLWQTFFLQTGRERSMRRVFLSLGVAGLLLVGAGQTQASPVFQAYSTADTVGNQAWPGNLGVDFNVNSPITITALGAFDSNGLAFSPGITVGLFQRLPGTPDPSFDHAATLITSVTITSGFQSGNYLFNSIAPLTLGPGFYNVTAVGFNGLNLNLNENFNDGSLINTNDGGGLLSFVGNGRFDGNGSLDYPALTTAQSGYPGTSAHVFGGGSFLYSAVSTTVPEPGSLTLLGLGLVSAGVFGWMKKRKASTVA